MRYIIKNSEGADHDIAYSKAEAEAIAEAIGGTIEPTGRTFRPGIKVDTSLDDGKQKDKCYCGLAFSCPIHK